MLDRRTTPTECKTTDIVKHAQLKNSMRVSSHPCSTPPEGSYLVNDEAISATARRLFVSSGTVQAQKAPPLELDNTEMVDVAHLFAP